MKKTCSYPHTNVIYETRLTMHVSRFGAMSVTSIYVIFNYCRIRASPIPLRICALQSVDWVALSLFQKVLGLESLKSSQRWPASDHWIWMEANQHGAWPLLLSISALKTTSSVHFSGIAGPQYFTTPPIVAMYAFPSGVFTRSPPHVFPVTCLLLSASGNGFSRDIENSFRKRLRRGFPCTTRERGCSGFWACVESE